MDDKEESDFRKTIEGRSKIIADDMKLDQSYQQYVEKVAPMYDAFIEPYFGRIHTALRQRGFLPNMMNRKKRLLLMNLIRCEAHRDVLMKLLKSYE